MVVQYTAYQTLLINTVFGGRDRTVFDIIEFDITEFNLTKQIRVKRDSTTVSLPLIKVAISNTKNNTINYMSCFSLS